MRQDFPFSGKWLINYDPNKYNYPEILVSLAKIHDSFKEKAIEFDSINIIFNKNGEINYFFKENGVIFLILNDINGVFEEKEAEPGNIALFEPLEKPIRTVSLLFPRLDSDPRWKTMGLPAGHMLLASSLKAGGFEPEARSLPLFGENRPAGALSADMTGITLFEDLLPLLGPFLADFEGSYGGILAAGGPFPTLAPLSAIYHLPQVNLFVRGEAELALPGILRALNSGDAEAFFANTGVFWQQPGMIAMAGFDQVIRPVDLGAVPIDFDFMEPDQAEHGLEMNFSRGCRRGCVFCCRAQGAKFRKLPLEKAEELLRAYKGTVENSIEDLQSPRPQAGLPPLVKGKEEPKYITNGIGGLMNQTPAKGNSKNSREGSKPSPTIGRIMGTARRAPTENGNGRDDRAPAHSRYTVNINDDDILQDPEYAAGIFKLIKNQELRIFGVQTSTASLLNDAGAPARAILNLVADPDLYVEGKPLLWLGTDAFVPARARRLGKKLPPPDKFRELMAEMERLGIRHYHYWISSDGDSNWMEFVEELRLIFSFFKGFPGFGLLAHAPFIVPYPSSALFARLPAGDPRLKIRLTLDAPDDRFRYRVVERLETGWPQLNCLLKNDRAGGEKGFFDFLKEKELTAAAQLAYHFLKQEMLQGSAMDPVLTSAREKLEDVIGRLMEDRT